MSYCSADEARDALVNEIDSIDDVWRCFDLRAFPLPMRVGRWVPSASPCWACAGNALHIYMRILPRNPQELATVPRDRDGTLELNTCTEVRQDTWTRNKLGSMEKIRVALKNMVLHEFYEALLFRGRRIMDPHNHNVRPKDQPF